MDAVKSGTDSDLFDVIWTGTFVVIGGDGAIMTSHDGISWTLRTSNTQNNPRSIAWTGRIFLVVGENGTALQSADGKGLFVAGEAGVILTSP